jgi:hypothetical protein
MEKKSNKTTQECWSVCLRGLVRRSRTHHQGRFSNGLKNGGFGVLTLTLKSNGDFTSTFSTL